MPYPDRQLSQYVPHCVQELISRQPPSRLPASDGFAGVVLITDIVGFGRITEAYADGGAEGAERLAGVLDQYFGRLTDVALDYGGDVVDYVGDALVAVWRGPDLAGATRCAVDCALALQDAVSEIAAVASLALQQRIAVNAGSLRLCALDGAGSRRHWLVAGECLVEAAAANRNAQPNQVVVCPGAWKLVADAYRGHGPTLDHGVVTGTGVGRLRSTDSPSNPPMQSSLIAGFVPAMAAWQTREQTRWLGEFRNISTVFIQLSGIRLPEASEVSPLQCAVSCIQRHIDGCGGSFERLSMDDKGVTALSAFGLPSMAHEDDAVRAIRAAIAIHSELLEQGISSSIGISRGRLFYGDFGSERRRHVGLVGESVNRAARLMMAASSAILCDAGGANDARHGARFEPAGRLTLKGQPEPVETFKPTGLCAKEALQITDPMVDRDAERDLLCRRQAELLEGNAGFLVIRGHAGIGKSRLLAEAALTARQQGIRVIECAGAAMEAATPYYPWRRLLAQLLSEDPFPDKRVLENELRTRLADDERLQSWMPLLNDILSLPVPDNDTTREIRGSARASSIRALLVHLVRKRATSDPVLLIADDLHWFDEASFAALARITALDDAPLLVLAGTRPQSRAGAGTGEALEEGADIVDLDVLPAEEMPAFVAHKLGIEAAPPELSRFVFDRAGGHALYSEELVAALKSSGLVAVEKGECRLHAKFAQAALTSLPDKLEGVIVSNFDRLDTDTQALLKGACVAGREFSMSMMAALLPHVAGTMSHLVENAVAQRFVVRDGAACAFRHAVLRDVIYGLLPFSQRRGLHAQVARWLEQDEPRQVRSRAAELAQHWEAAGNIPKALDNLEHAAHHAFASNANREAIRHIHRAYELRTTRTDSATAPVAEWEAVLGDAHQELFEYGSSVRHYHQALRLLGRQGDASQVRRLVSLFVEAVIQGLHRIPRVRRGRPDANRLARTRRASHIHQRLSEIAFFNNQPVELLYQTLASVNLAEESNFTYAKVGGYAGLAMAWLATGRAQLASAYSRRSMAAAVEGGPADVAYSHLGNMVYGASCGNWQSVWDSAMVAAPLYRQLGVVGRWQQIHCINAFSSLMHGNFIEADAALAELEAATDDVVPTQIAAFIQCGRAWLAIVHGDVDRLAQHARHLLEIQQRQGVSSSERLLCMGLAARALHSIGDDEGSAAAADDALRLLRVQAPLTYYLSFALAGIADVKLACWQRAADSADARRLREEAQEAVAVVRRFSRLCPPHRPRALLAEARYAWQCGRVSAADRYWKQAIFEAEGRDMLYEKAQALYMMGTCVLPHEPEAAARRKEAAAIFTRLGARPLG